MRRENTFRIDYSNFPVKPSFEKVHGFCRTVLGLKKEDVLRLQCSRGEQCAFVKVGDLTLAQKIVEEHDGRHEVEIDGKKHKLRITIEDGSVEVKVHDLPENVTKEKIVEFLRVFGEVISVHELTWGESYEFAGIPLGIWSARMLLNRNIDSWVTIDGQQAYVVYKGQVLSCKHCKEQAHSGISCVQNKKLLVQKSYANVAKQSGIRQPPKKSSGVKPPNTKSVASTAPSLASPVAFPELPKLPSRTEQSAPATKINSQSDKIDLTASPSPHQHRAQGPSSSHRTTQQATEATQPNVAVVDLFKKPIHALRSHSKNGNGNETDESSASTSSRRSRGRPPGKKPRREDDDDEQDEDSQQ